MKAYAIGQVPTGYAPLPPENVLINGARYPATISGAYTISWAPNPREHFHGPAVSGDETYTLRLYGETDNLRRTVTGLTSTSYTWSTEAVDSGLADPYWSNVVALMHMDGADGSTTFTDEKGKIFAVNGNVQIDTAQSKFGGASALFDGSGDYLSLAATADFGFGTATDFTVEAFIRLSTAGMGTDRTITDFRKAPGTEATFFVNASNKLVVWHGSAMGGTGTALSANTWYHVSLPRSGSTTRCFLDGVLQWTATTAIDFGSTAPLGIGAGVHTGGEGVSPFAGHMDEIRITKGVARYTADFTPPSAAFPGAGRLNTSVRAELETVRGGVTSYQKQNVKVVRV